MGTSHAVPNRILCADAYTVSSFESVSPEMHERAAYHVVFRHFESPAGLEGLGEGKLVFHGLTGILRKLLERPLEQTEIDEAREFLATFHFGARAYPADWAMWDRIAELGYFPLQIYARRDGSIVNAGEPVIQVLSAPGFGELAAHFESKLLQCWAPSARATLLRRWLEYNEQLVQRTTDLSDAATVRSLAQMQLSDFGDRAGSCAEESEVLGLAHLTSHAGTDTLCAAFDAWRASGKRFHPSSIRALAHRVVQGHAAESQAFDVLYHRSQEGGIGSYVADCYDFERAVTQYLLPLAARAAQDGLIVVARPDSGDALRSIRFILDRACEAGLYRINSKGLIEMTSLRYIYADALNFETIRHHINEPLVQSGFAVPMCGVYGVGGFLRNGISRDKMGAAMKLCAVGSQLRPVAKLSRGIKASIPGLVRVEARYDGGPTVHPTSPAEADYGELRLLYDRGRFTEDFEEGTDFMNVRRRVLEDWELFVPSMSVLGEGIRRRISELEARHLPGEAGVNGAWAVMRLGAPHEGHAALVGRMLEGHPREPVLVLIGSSDTTGRPDVPLPWETRRDLLGRLLEAQGRDARAVAYAPLPEIPIPGFTHQWFEHVLAACRAAVGCALGHHYFGEDYALESFGILLEMLPGVRLHRVPRTIRKSGTELRRAVATREPELLEKYRLELSLYPASALERIERVSLLRGGGAL